MFWNNFVTYCRKSNTTPTAVTRELNISSGNVTAWKKGRVPKWGTLVKIANYFDITPDVLIAENTKITDNSSMSNNTINGNYNVVGNNSQIYVKEELSPQEQELISIFRRLSEVNKAKALIHICELTQENMMA